MPGEVEVPPANLRVFDFLVEVYEDKSYIIIYDPDYKLNRENSRKIADWVNMEGFILKPFDVKIFRAKIEEPPKHERQW